MKTFLVVNPASANGQTGRRWLELEACLRRDLGTLAFAFTQKPLDAELLTRKALAEGFECVVAVGGDGTVNEVVNGFFDGTACVNSSAVLGVIPRGTGGDFRRTFQWGDDMEAAAKRIVSGSDRAIDVGRLEFIRTDGQSGVRHFANVCSFGVSGLVDLEVNRSTKLFGGKVSFMVGSVKALLKYRDLTVSVSFDGQPAQQYQVTTLAVCNGRYFGGGMCVAPGADPSDGFFDVTVWSGYGLADFALKSAAIYDGSHVGFKGTTQVRCRSVEASSSEEVLLDVDGEQPGRLPCKMSLLPGAIRLRA